MIFIKDKILLSVVISLLLSSTIITLQRSEAVEVFDTNFGADSRKHWQDSSPYIRHDHEHDENFTQGYYRGSSQYGLEPGSYNIEVDPVGENVTLYLIDGEKTLEKELNESISFETDLETNTIWIGIIIGDPLTFEEHTGEVFEIEIEKEREILDYPLIMLWILTLIGVIYLGVDTYSKKRE